MSPRRSRRALRVAALSLLVPALGAPVVDASAAELRPVPSRSVTYPQHDEETPGADGFPGENEITPTGVGYWWCWYSGEC